jgi:hypothetical protein
MNPPFEFNLRQEADYVLGMMDLYENDREIAGILRTKGLTNEQVAEVLALVKQDGYAKRLRQAKRIMLIGFGITILAAIPYIFFQAQIRSLENETDPIGRWNVRSITGPFFYALVYGIGQSVWGTIRFFTYSKKMRHIS